MIDKMQSFGFFLLLFFIACQNINDAARLNTIDTAYQDFEERKDVSSLVVPDSASLASETAFYSKQLSKLKVLNTEKLEADELTQYRKLKETFENKLWLLQELKLHEWKLSNYNYYNNLSETTWSKPELLKASATYYETVKSITENTIPSEAEIFINSHIKIYKDLKNMKKGKELEIVKLIDENLLLIKDVIAYAVSLRNNTTVEEVDAIQGNLSKIEIQK